MYEIRVRTCLACLLGILTTFFRIEGVMWSPDATIKVSTAVQRWREVRVWTRKRPQGQAMAKKTNHESATLRKERPAKVEKVRNAVAVRGAAVRAARKQNSDESGNLTVIPNTKKSQVSAQNFAQSG
jgi:hypothetical protein